MRFWERIKFFCKKPFMASVPFSRILFDDKPAYVEEGFGGKSLEHWPPFGFYDMHVRGAVKEATEKYAAWYRDQFGKYGGVPKNGGGMRGGSLQMTINRMGEGVDAVERGIARRVEERFALLENIRRSGYRLDPKDLIHGIRREGMVYLKNGHHRAAALKALGHSRVPFVVVYSYWFGRLLGY